MHTFLAPPAQAERSKKVQLARRNSDANRHVLLLTSQLQALERPQAAPQSAGSSPSPHPHPPRPSARASVLRAAVCTALIHTVHSMYSTVQNLRMWGQSVQFTVCSLLCRVVSHIPRAVRKIFQTSTRWTLKAYGLECLAVFYFVWGCGAVFHTSLEVNKTIQSDLVE